MLVLHGWLGLAVGLFLSICGLSGAILILRPSLEPRAVTAMNVAPQSARATWQAALESAAGASEGARVEHIFVSPSPKRALEVWTRKGERLIYVDPHTAQVLGVREPRRDFWGWLSGLHTELLSGERGHSAVGWCGVSLFVLGISGLFLWWPRGALASASTWRRALTMKWKAPAHVRFFEWHRVLGFFACGLYLVIGATGAALVWPEAASSTFARVLGGSAAPKPKAKASGAMRELDLLVSAAQAKFPEGTLRRISFPAKAGAPLSIRFRLPGEMHPNGVNTVFLDAASGRVLGVQDTRVAPLDQRAMFLRYPLHTGEWGGLFSKALAVAVGLLLPTLWVSGVIMWARRRKAGRNPTPRKRL